MKPLNILYFIQVDINPLRVIIKLYSVSTLREELMVSCFQRVVRLRPPEGVCTCSKAFLFWDREILRASGSFLQIRYWMKEKRSENDKWGDMSSKLHSYPPLKFR